MSHTLDSHQQEAARLFKSKENYEEWYDLVMAISSCPFENVGTSLQALAVEWLNEVVETTAAAWFEQHWTGPHNGRWTCKRVASHKSKVQHIVLYGVFNPDMCTYRGLLHRRHLAREHVAEVRYESIILKKKRKWYREKLK